MKRGAGRNQGRGETMSRGLLDQLKREVKRAEKRGISRYRLAQLSGVTQATISRLMSGKLPTPSVVIVEKLVKGLELEIVIRSPE